MQDDRVLQDSNTLPARPAKKPYHELMKYTFTARMAEEGLWKVGKLERGGLARHMTYDTSGAAFNGGNQALQDEEERELTFALEMEELKLTSLPMRSKQAKTCLGSKVSFAANMFG